MLISITPGDSTTSNLPMTPRSLRYSVLSRTWTPGSPIQFAPPPTTETQAQDASLPSVSRLCATTCVSQQDFPKQTKLQAEHFQRPHVKQTGGFCGAVLRTVFMIIIAMVFRFLLAWSLRSPCPLCHGLFTISIGGMKEDAKCLVTCNISRLFSTAVSALETVLEYLSRFNY
ncbi:hypothetical protein BDP81DRAFT_170203 [Colletotrichum phormii]|uniref:Uncharacterized protein n=1 Tax=Colletotrichum phormii TaxID=359342 RepID=A0AAI9ZCG5_9PEZI|nr:uncharacterized protein BDP81DRAFT_170203 [Colletotrichum phormii]KAK1621881.1 hypothetical protein BDP81DRAFT_170203 [Colletotrichum phormii]